MKRVIIMKGFGDLIYDLGTNSMEFLEQKRIFLENFQKRMHLYWSTSSSIDDTESRSTPTLTENIL